MNIKIFLSFAIVYFIWGSTFTAIKYGLESFPPFLMAGLRFIIAGLFFLLIARWKEFKLLSMKEVSREVFVGFLLTLGNAGVCWSEQYISSGVAALIVGAVPIMFMLANWIGFERKTPHSSSVFAFVLGLGGITLISMDNSGASDWRVVLALLLANCFWVSGSLIIRTAKSSVSYYPRASIQMLFGGCSLILMSTLLGERTVNWSETTSFGYLSLGYLAVAGTVLAYTAYSYLLKTVRTELTSTYALVNPLIAIFFGILFLNEPFTVKISVAAALIILSIVLVLYGDKLFKPAKVIVSSDEGDKIDLKRCS